MIKNHFSGCTNADSSSRCSLDTITALRGVLALYVAGYHTVSNFPQFTFLEPLFDGGYLAVDCFFVLSGFFLSYTYGARFSAGTFSAGSYRQYLLLRLARIYPVHLCVLLLFVLAFTLIPGFSALFYQNLNQSSDFYALSHLSLNILLLQNWAYPPGGGVTGWNSPAWSLSCEWLLYLLFPLQLFLTQKQKKAGIAFRYACMALGLFYLSYYGGALSISYGYMGFWRAFFGFNMGMLAYAVFCRLQERSGASKPVSCWPFLVCLFLGLLVFLLSLDLASRSVRDFYVVLIVGVFISAAVWIITDTKAKIAAGSGSWFRKVFWGSFYLLQLVLLFVTLLRLNISTREMRDVFVVMVAVPFIVSLALVNQGRIKKIIANPVTLYCGNISYSLYMVHWLVVFLVEYYLTLFHVTLPPFLNLVVVFSVVLMAASLMYHGVEKPLRAYFRQRVYRQVQQYES